MISDMNFAQERGKKLHKRVDMGQQRGKSRHGTAW